MTSTRFADIDAELDRLCTRHDQAMSAFRFDEANALQVRIGRLEAKRRDLTASSPAPTAAPETAAGVVPTLLRPRGVRRSRPPPRR